MKAQFKVQHEILAGLKYLQKVSRMGVSSKMQEMMVRFHNTSPPSDVRL
jgi:Rho GDP-dissociation inhibitor